MITKWLRGVVIGFMLSGNGAYAHDLWADGTEVPAWVKSSCCGPDDAHLLLPEQVHRVNEGYKVDGYPDVIPFSKVLPSQDGNYWIFYSVTLRGGGGVDYSPVYCFFVPMGA